MKRPQDKTTRFRWFPIAIALVSAPFLLFSACALLGVGGGETLTHSKNYSVTAPASWKEESRGDADRAYRLGSGNLATLTSSCNREPAPLEALTRHLLFGVRNLKVLERKKLSVNGSEALLSRIKGTFDGRAVEMLVCVLAKEGCVFDFVLLAPKKLSESDAQEFGRYVESFTYGK